MRTAWFLIACVGGGVVWGGSGCNQPVYIAENRPLDAQLPPMMAGDDDTDTTFTDTDLFVLPVRKPTDAEKKALDAERTKLNLPMPVPWVGVRDMAIEMEWSIKNLSDKPITARVFLNGGNEFGDYEPMLFTQADVDPEDQATPPNMINNGDFLPIAANGVLEGVFREDEFAEAGLDLEAITRYPPPNAGLNTPFMVLLRDSSVSRIGLEGIPAGDITPAVVRINITLQGTGPCALDYTIRVRENGNPRDKLAKKGEQNLYVSTAAVLAPPVTPTPLPGMTDD